MKKQLTFRPINYALGLFLLVSLFTISCGNDDDPVSNDDDGEVITDDDGGESTENKTSGFIFRGTTASGSSRVIYLDELPEDQSTIDLTNGEDFPTFFPVSIYDGAIFLPRPDQGAGFSKYVVNSERELTLEGNIATVSETSPRIFVKDEQTGIFQDRNTPNIISTFNPETLEITGNIDMSEGFVPGDIEHRYQSFYFRGDDVFGTIRGLDNTIFPSFIVHQANLSTNSFVGSTQRDGNGVSPITTYNQYGQSFVDNQGILYIPDGGNQTGAGLPARINRILPGTNEFDPTYTFDPAFILNPQNVFLPSILDFTVIQEQTAIAIVNETTPQAAIDIVLDAGGVGNLSQMQIDEIFSILFVAESARWCVLDLNNQTVTPISGIPGLSPFNQGNVFRDTNGDVMIPISTNSENAYYRYNPTTGSTTKAFDVIGSSDAWGVNIGNNN